jgi:phage portal protein BeeE
MTYQPLTINAVDSQMIEQLKLTGETICSAFHVPPFMVGIGAAPTYNNIEALNQQYYSQCLQALIEEIEELLDQGLGLGKDFGNTYGTEFDLDALLRMDTATKVKSVADAIGAGFMSPNEGRYKFDLPPVEGGNSPYLQVQNYSLAALNRRDQQENPVTPGATPAVPSPPEETLPDDQSGGDAEASDDERQRNVVALADRLQRRAIDYARRAS